MSDLVSIQVFAGQIISFSAPTSGLVGDTRVLTASATSGLPVTFASQTPAVCRMSGSSVNFLAEGACTVVASQGGDSDWAPAAQIAQTISVSKSARTVTIQLIGTLARIGDHATVTGTPSAGGGRATVHATGGCTYANFEVTITSAGLCLIDVFFASDGTYAAASAQLPVVIGKVMTGTTLVITNLPVVVGKPLALTATVTPANATLAMTGTMIFMNGSAIIGQAAIANGVASVTAPTLTGTTAAALVAVYSGDTNYATSTSATVAATPSNAASDPTVRNLVSSQVAALQKIASVQSETVGRRVEDLHGDVPGFVNGISLDLSPDASAHAEWPGGALAYAEARRKTPAGGAAIDGSVVPGTRPGAPFRTLEPDVYVWTSGTLTFNRDKAPGSGDRLGGDSQSVTLGLDTRLAPGLKAGLTFGGFTGSSKLDLFGSKSKSTGWSTTLYGSYDVGGGVFFDALLGYGDARLTSKRYDATALGMFTGTRQGEVLFGSLIASWDQKDGALKYAPYVRLDLNRVFLDSYAESGVAGYALDFAKLATTSETVVVGLHGQYDMQMDGMTVSPTARFEYRHLVQGSISQSLTYVADPSTIYGMTLAGNRRDAFVGSIGLKVAGEGNVSGEIEYTAGYTRAGFAGQGLRGGVRFGF